MDQRFIEVEDEGLAAADVLWLGPQEAILSGGSPEYEVVPTRQDLAKLLLNIRE